MKKSHRVVVTDAVVGLGYFMQFGGVGCGILASNTLLVSSKVEMLFFNGNL